MCVCVCVCVCEADGQGEGEAEVACEGYSVHVKGLCVCEARVKPGKF